MIRKIKKVSTTKIISFHFFVFFSWTLFEYYSEYSRYLDMDVNPVSSDVYWYGGNYYNTNTNWIGFASVSDNNQLTVSQVSESWKNKTYCRFSFGLVLWSFIFLWRGVQITDFVIRKLLLQVVSCELLASNLVFPNAWQIFEY